MVQYIVEPYKIRISKAIATRISSLYHVDMASVKDKFMQDPFRARIRNLETGETLEGLLEWRAAVRKAESLNRQAKQS